MITEAIDRLDREPEDVATRRPGYCDVNWQYDAETMKGVCNVCGGNYGQPANADPWKECPLQQGVIKRFDPPEPEPMPLLSQTGGIGTRIAENLKKQPFGVTIECEECRAEVERLNTLSVPQARADAERLVDALYSRRHKLSGWKSVAVRTGPEAAVKGLLQTAVVNPAIRAHERETITVVWPNYARAAVQDELHHSVQSIAKFGQNVRNVFCVGDVPQWWGGPSLAMPQILRRHVPRENRRWLPICDTMNRLYAVCHDDDVSERFVWFYDDMFLCRETDVTELPVRYRTKLGGKAPDTEYTKAWIESKRRTYHTLKEHGMTTLDGDFHCPKVYEKQKVLETFERFAPHENVLAFSSLYLNHHFPADAQRCQGEFRYVWKWKRKDTIADEISLCVGQFNPYARREVRRQLGYTVNPAEPPPYRLRKRGCGCGKG